MEGDAVRTGDYRFFVGNYWVRLIWGQTLRRARVRCLRFHGYRLVAVRLRGERLVGLQWTHADNRLTVDGKRAPA